MEDVKPYYISFSMSKMLAARAEMMKKLLAMKENIHMSIFTFYDELRNLPKECSMVVQLDGANGFIGIWD